MVRVLFVCTGNICRSPMAEAVFRALVAERGLLGTVDVDSAGINDFHAGDPPDPRAISIAQKHGIPMGDLRARQFQDQDFSDFDLILAMDSGHLRHLKKRCPPHLQNRVRLFLDFAPETGRKDVIDPYYGDQADFEMVFDLIQTGAARLLSQIQ